jgi:hypothetical protein
MSLEHSEEPVLPREAELARLLAEMIENAPQSRIPDIQAVVGRDAALGDELRELWLTAQLADELARASELDATIDHSQAMGVARGEPSERGAAPTRMSRCMTSEFTRVSLISS